MTYKPRGGLFYSGSIEVCLMSNLHLFSVEFVK